MELVQSETTSNAFYSSLLADCGSLLGRFQHCKVQHVFREVSRVADVLAKFVYSDAMGENFCRLIVSNLAILT